MGTCRDISNFCESASLEEMRKRGYILTPGRCRTGRGRRTIRAIDGMAGTQLRAKQPGAAKLDALIVANLKALNA